MSSPPKNIRISIITVCLNSEKTIFDCLQSIRIQNYPNVESIIVDGGSSDNTIDIVNQFQDIVTGICCDPGLGIYDAINKGMEMANGEIIGVLNSDDLFMDETSISSIAEPFMNDPATDIVYGDLVYVDVNDVNKVTRYWKSGLSSYKNFERGWMPPHPTFYIRRHLITQVGPYRNDMGSAGDYEFMLRAMLKHHLKFCYVPKVLVKMRRGGISNGSIFRRLKANLKDKKAWSVNGLKPHFLFSLMKPLRKLDQYFIKNKGG